MFDLRESSNYFGLNKSSMDKDKDRYQIDLISECVKLKFWRS